MLQLLLPLLPSVDSRTSFVSLYFIEFRPLWSLTSTVIFFKINCGMSVIIIIIHVKRLKIKRFLKNRPDARLCCSQFREEMLVQRILDYLIVIRSLPLGKEIVQWRKVILASKYLSSSSDRRYSQTYPTSDYEYSQPIRRNINQNGDRIKIKSD